MFNLLISQGNVQEHYFSQPDRGIFTRRKGPDGLWSDAECVIDNSGVVFWVYSDSSNTTNMIYLDRDNNLSYALRKKGSWKSFSLARLNSEIIPIKMRLYPVSGRLNLLHSSMYDNEYILVHCILGNRAMPQVVNRMASPHFVVYKKRVYYTKQDGYLGYTDLSDEKPEGFNKINDFGSDVVLYDANGTDLMLFSHENRLFINQKEIIYDSRMEMPTLATSSGILYAMWRSGGYVRYITSINNGEIWSSPMRFMASGAEIQTYHAQHQGNDRFFYGYNTPYELHLFGKPDLF